MSIFIISDLHLFHRNIHAFEPIRYQIGNTLEEMNWNIVKLWNSVVQPEDEVYNLGDVAFQLGEKINEINHIVQSMNGYKILIRGNHDHKKDEVYLRMGFKQVLWGPVDFGKYVLSHEPILDTKVLNIHGHTHHTLINENMGLFRCVSIEVLPNFTPIRLSEVLKSGKYATIIEGQEPHHEPFFIPSQRWTPTTY